MTFTESPIATFLEFEIHVNQKLTVELRCI